MTVVGKHEQEGPAARATGPYFKLEPNRYGLVGCVVAGADSSAGLWWCFLAFLSDLASVASVEPGSEAVAELGVPLEAALSACGADIEAEESVEVDDVEFWSDDGAAWVVWAEGSLAGAVCWARADPA